MPEVKKEGNKINRFYQGPSPDEVTLVEMAQQHGYEYVDGNEGLAKVEVKRPLAFIGSIVDEWEIIKTIEFNVIRRMEFNSDRKRMSILLQDPEDGHYKLYVKGADSIILERLDEHQIDPDMMTKIDGFLTKASTKGYRTLLMAMRVVDEEEVR